MMGKSKGKLSKEETEMILKTCKAYEAKLIELMGKDAFIVFSTEIARDLFADSILGMSESPFKEFCLDNFDMITQNPFPAPENEEDDENGKDQ